ncbi:MAG: DUF2190 family protein [Pseudobacteriovorax sp.]|nr:DUF2190 family protein [Pseudobacteriovorax sp.]NRA68626.1 DUF2190 family protein [Pseudobacteriovorax sp.]
MKNFIQPGHALTIKNSPVAASSGDQILIGSIFGVSVADVEEGGNLVLQIEGVFWFRKNRSEVITTGQQLSVDSGRLTNDISTGPIVAVAIEDAVEDQILVAAKILPTVIPGDNQPAPDPTRITPSSLLTENDHILDPIGGFGPESDDQPEPEPSPIPIEEEENA